MISVCYLFAVWGKNEGHMIDIKEKVFDVKILLFEPICRA